MPEPERLELARRAIAMRPEIGRGVLREGLLGGVEADRRDVVLAWIEEIDPDFGARALEAMAIQMAGLFDDDELRSLSVGKEVEFPKLKALTAASPPPTMEDLALSKELKRRYCARYECEIANNDS